MINIEQVVESHSIESAQALQSLYATNRAEFIRLVKPRLKFAFSINGKSSGKYRRRFDGDYCLIEADSNDVIRATDKFQRVEPFRVSAANHIPVGNTVKSRVFGIASYVLSGGHLDCP